MVAWNAVKERLLGAHFASSDIQEAYTTASGQATNLVKSGIRGHAHVVAVGGDGTNNEVVNGLMSLPAHVRRNISYALLPCGTGNDLAKHFGIPHRPDPWISMFKSNRTIPIDIGQVEWQSQGRDQCRYFVNEASFALSAYVVAQLSNRHSGSNHKMSYLWQAVKGLFSYEEEGLRISCKSGPTYEGQVLTLNIGNGRYAGGGLQLTPWASPHDGLLDVTLLGKLPLRIVLAHLPKLLTGRIYRVRSVRHWKTSSLTVEPIADEKLLVEVDGELCGQAPCKITLRQQSLNFVVPTKYKTK